MFVYSQPDSAKTGGKILEETKPNMMVDANGISSIQFLLTACALLSKFQSL